jgi:hypothetical protein
MRCYYWRRALVGQNYYYFVGFKALSCLLWLVQFQTRLNYLSLRPVRASHLTLFQVGQVQCSLEGPCDEKEDAFLALP